MTLSYRIRDFPPIAIEKQLFHVPGLSIDGGFTVGGARISSPAPGGRAVLELQPSLRHEAGSPLSSWLMSKINGEIFRVRLARTPQIADSSLIVRPRGGTMYGGGYRDLYTNQPDIIYDLEARYIVAALEGSSLVRVDLTKYGPVLRVGHVIGHGDYCYIIDDISYSGATAIIEVSPPLRRTIQAGDAAPLRPNFLGSIANGESIRNAYDAANAGYVQLGNIIFNEVVI